LIEALASGETDTDETLDAEDDEDEETEELLEDEDGLLDDDELFDEDDELELELLDEDELLTPPSSERTVSDEELLEDRFSISSTFMMVPPCSTLARAWPVTRTCMPT
jgi:hypothetical protein